MKTIICRVLSQTEATLVKTKDGDKQKCFVRLKETGDNFTDEYNCTVMGNLAQVKFQVGEVVAAAIKFRLHEFEGNTYQDITAEDIVQI